MYAKAWNANTRASVCTSFICERSDNKNWFVFVKYIPVFYRICCYFSTFTTSPSPKSQSLSSSNHLSVVRFFFLLFSFTLSLLRLCHKLIIKSRTPVNFTLFPDCFLVVSGLCVYVEAFYFTFSPRMYVAFWLLCVVSHPHTTFWPCFVYVPFLF